MAFYIYDISFLILFCLFLIGFLWKRRANLKREGLMYLYRTKVGIKFIDYIGLKYKKTLTVLSVLAVISGYILMISMIYLLGRLVYVYLFVPELVKAIKIPPLLPLIPYVPELFKINFLPPFYFTYWIIAIAIIAVVHEFSHGIIARRYGVKIKTTGFGFLGPFLAAFVEPDEKQMGKKPKFQQISILSAGTFSNLILAGIFFALLFLFFTMAYAPNGAIFNTYTSKVINVNSISMIGGLYISNYTGAEIIELIKEKNISNDIALGSQGNILDLTKITVDNKTYFVDSSVLEQQIETYGDFAILYEDLPAINLGMKGVIISFNGAKIKDYTDLANTMKNYKPGDMVKIKTKDGENIIEYEVKLAESPDKRGVAVIGIGYLSTSQKGVLSKVFNFFNFFKKPATSYAPKFDGELIIFIYNLLWWLALINLSVALVNMWPVAIFDGGRMFMLSVWAITGSEKFAKMTFKILTYAMLGAIFLLMIGWFIAMF